MTIEPGVYTMDPATYHGHTHVLSHTGAIKLLPPSCPARFAHWRDHPEEDEPSKDFDIGRAVHDLVLRGVDQVVVIHRDDYRTKDASSLRDAAWAAGKTPLLVKQWQRVQDMAEALWSNPLASALLRGGRPEQALFWRDEDHGIYRRALLDFLPDRPAADMHGVDYKSAKSAHPTDVEKAIWSYRYMCQGAWYLDGIRALGLADAEHTPFFFIVQEKVPPYVVTVAQLEPDALRAGRQLNRQAIDLYRRCLAANRWPGYCDDVVMVGLPSYAEYQLDEILEESVPT